ncbi:unnamed protein product [Scytosiphon promiscuus]
MSVTLRVSSDIVGGVLGLLLAAASFTIACFAYPRLIATSASEAVKSGRTIQASTRSINSIRNWVGFWAISLSTLARLLAFCLEFGILGFSESLLSERPVVILGGGRRFSHNQTADGSIFMDSTHSLPDLFSIAVGACFSLVNTDDFRMIKNNYPAIDVSQNSSGTYVSEYNISECTSSWLGSAEWLIEPSGGLIIDLETVTEQYRYEDDVYWSYADDGLYQISADFLSISYGFGSSYRGEDVPVVVLNISTSSSTIEFGISISEESGHFVYSMAEGLDYSRAGEKEVLNGTYTYGHYRSSEFSLGGVVCLALTLLIRGGDDSLSTMYTASEAWWVSESVDGDYLVHSNPQGSEQLWPSLSNASGFSYTDYVKGSEPTLFHFTVGEREATMVSSWCLVLAIALAVVFVALTFASLFLVKTTDGFATYDGLSHMVSGSDDPKSLALIGIVGGEGSKRIGLVRSVDSTGDTADPSLNGASANGLLRRERRSSRSRTPQIVPCP